MACCMAEKYGGWCHGIKDTKVIDGKEYCIFHAPADKKQGFQRTEYESLLWRIQLIYIQAGLVEKGVTKYIPEREVCNFSGTIFSDDFEIDIFKEAFTKLCKKNSKNTNDIDLAATTDSYSIPEINFNKCTFNGNASFIDHTIGESLNLSNCIFNKKTTFIHTKLNSNELTDLSNSIFIGIVDFSFTHISSDICFDNSVFKSNVLFSNTILESGLSFQGCTLHHQFYLDKSKVTGIVNFSRSKYLDTFDINSTIFEDNVLFGPSTFENNYTLQECSFEGECLFSHSKFKGNTSIDNTQFSDTCIFKFCIFEQASLWFESIFAKGATFFSSKFYEYTFFDKIKFNDNLDMDMCCFNELDFTNSLVNKTSFSSSTLHITSFSGTHFNGPAYFDNSYFCNDTNFDNTIFNSFASFELCSFCGETTFKQVLFENRVYLREADFLKKISFAGAISKDTILIETSNLQNLSLSKTNIESFEFTECSWGENGSSIIYDEKNKTELGISNSTLEEIYRRLKKKAKDRADEMQASNWHYKEKEMQKLNIEAQTPLPDKISCIVILSCIIPVYLYLQDQAHTIFSANSYLALISMYTYSRRKDILKSKNFFTKSYLIIYSLISGYGERPLKALGVFLSLISLSFIITLTLPPLTSINPQIKMNILKQWLWYLPLVKIEVSDPSSLNYLWKCILSIIIPTQAALFAFALRNKLRR